MKKCILLLLAVLTLTFTACEKENYAPFNEEQGDEWTDDSNDDDGGEESDEEGALTLYKISGDEITKIRDYEVPARLQTYQNDEARHRAIWNYFTRLIPAEARTRIVEFEVLVSDDLGGYVTPLDDNDLSRWKMGLNVESFGDLSVIDLREESAQLVIHELGHVLTLDDTQVAVGGDEESCAEFFTGEGCSNSSAYINRLFDLGWADIYDDHDLDRPEKTYDRYPNRFVTEYAATNPGEDIAETIAFFISEPNRRTGTSIADRKIQLMYEFPALVALRDKIRANADVSGLTEGVSLGKLRAGGKVHHAGHRH